jgi:DNA-directed RNA polymerase subunit N (RpoN/RPB10)
MASSWCFFGRVVGSQYGEYKSGRHEKEAARQTLKSAGLKKTSCR